MDSFEPQWKNNCENGRRWPLSCRSSLACYAKQVLVIALHCYNILIKSMAACSGTEMLCLRWSLCVLTWLLAVRYVSMFETMQLFCVKQEWIGTAQRTPPFVAAWAVAFVPDPFGKKNSWEVFLAGEQCFMLNPDAVWKFLSVERYKRRWPLIPEAELLASSVSVSDSFGQKVQVLLHKRRVDGDMTCDSCICLSRLLLCIFPEATQAMQVFAGQRSLAWAA